MEESILTQLLRHHFKGKNISAIARETKIPPTLLHDWYQARRAPSFKNLIYVKRLADYLEMPFEELLFGSSPKTTKKEEKILTRLDFDDDGRSYEVKIIRKIDSPSDFGKSKNRK